MRTKYEKKSKADMLRKTYLIIISKLYIFYGAFRKKQNFTYLLEITSSLKLKIM